MGGIAATSCFGCPRANPERREKEPKKTNGLLVFKRFYLLLRTMAERLNLDECLRKAIIHEGKVFVQRLTNRRLANGTLAPASPEDGGLDRDLYWIPAEIPDFERGSGALHFLFRPNEAEAAAKGEKMTNLKPLTYRHVYPGTAAQLLQWLEGQPAKTTEKAFADRLPASILERARLDAAAAAADAEIEAEAARKKAEARAKIQAATPKPTQPATK